MLINFVCTGQASTEAVGGATEEAGEEKEAEPKEKKLTRKELKKLKKQVWPCDERRWLIPLNLIDCFCFGRRSFEDS